MSPRRDYILAGVAIIAQVSVISAVVASWVSPPENTEIVIGSLAFCQNLVLGIVGYFAGASTPDGRS